MPIYVKIPGIAGPVTAPGKVGWISVDSCEASMAGLTFVKKVDIASGGLARWAAVGGPVTPDTIDVAMVALAGSQWVDYLKYTVNGGTITHYDQSADDSMEEKGTEVFTIAFVKIGIVMTEYDESGRAVKSSKANYSLLPGPPR